VVEAPAVPAAQPVALITGASSGIGEALAKLLAASGYTVALLARRRERLETVAAAVAANGGRALVLVADATDRDAVQRAVAEVLRTAGRLDVVVANAGVYTRAAATAVTVAEVEAALRDNFWSAFHLAQAALPTLRAQHAGHLVFINSFDAKKGMPSDAAYVAAKCALAGYAGTLRQALRADGVHVCTVFPGRVDTAMMDGIVVPAISAKITPERVACAVLRALRRRSAEVVVPWHCRLLLWAEVLSPRLGDWFVRVLRLDGERR
jgi:short-subunit dehydrogenase